MDSIYLLLSPNCNLSCKYCFQHHSAVEIPGTHYHAQLGVKASIEIIARFAEFCAENNIKHVEFFGGEPLLYRDLFHAAVETIAKRNPQITIGIVTNGTMIDEGIMQLFERHRISVLLSLDGRQDRHDSMRGGFERIRVWFPRLSRLDEVMVAMQAAIIPELSQNVQYVWRQGFTSIYLNMMENYGWYKEADVCLFEAEYDELVRAMLRGEGILACAMQIHEQLHHTSYSQGCGITRLGLACDWHGRLYPCHRAVELGTEFAIGDIFSGVNTDLDQKLRRRIHEEAFRSTSSKQHPLTSFCPVAIYQKHRNFEGEWSRQFCRMIEIKTKIVAKYFHEIRQFIAAADACDKGHNKLTRVADEMSEIQEELERVIR